MPKKATKGKTVILAVRMTPEQVRIVDSLVDKGAAPSRTDFVKDAIQLKIYIEENRLATMVFTVPEEPQADTQTEKKLA